jgi:hypothetical protein
MKFYTYAHYTKDTNEIFYIGKGSVNKQTVYRRALAKNGRNCYWNNKVKKHGGYKVEILAHWETEEEAFDHEKLLISCFKNLTNLTTGGDGCSGRVQSQEEKNKRAESLRGKKRTEKALENMSKAQKRNKVALDTLKQEREKTKKKVLCIDTGQVFNSLSEAGLVTSIPFQNISKACLGKRPSAGGYRWEYTA